METIQFGNVAASAILTGILAMIYKAAGDKIPDRYRSIIAALFGIGLGLLHVSYSGQEYNVVTIVNGVLSGLMIGWAATGIYENQRTVTRPR